MSPKVDSELQEGLAQLYFQDPGCGLWTREKTEVFAYSDGTEIEQRILAAVTQSADVSLHSRDLVRHMVDWPSLYHLTPRRANVMRPFLERLQGARVLELGCGCGGVSRFLGEAGAQVIAVEGSERRAEIAAARCRDLDNVQVVVDKIQNLAFSAKFDVVTLIGVLEYSRMFVEAADPVQHILAMARSFLKDDGLLVVAIENQLGLKYFCGAPEDHVGEPMFGINDLYDEKSVVTFGRKELADRISAAGFGRCETYAAYPDYKLPLTIVYPKGIAEAPPSWDLGTLLSNTVVFDPQGVPTPQFSLDRAWHVIARNGLVADLANSFIVAGYVRADDQGESEPILAAHYSTERAAAYAKELHFVSEGENVLVRSRGIGATEAIQQEAWRYEPYRQGRLWADELHRVVQQRGWAVDQLAGWAETWIRALESRAIEAAELNDVPPEFSAYSRLIPGNHLDAIPHNLIIAPDGNGEFIDLEWEYPGYLPIELVLYRGLIVSLERLVSIAEPAFSVPRRFSDLAQAVLVRFGYELQTSDFALFLPVLDAFQREARGLEPSSNPPVEPDDRCLPGGRGVLGKPAKRSDIGELPPSVTNYEAWVYKHSLQEGEAQLLAERMVLKWTTRPQFHLLAFVAGENAALLVRTFNSLQPQLYKQWRLTIVSDQPAPAGLAEDQEILEWLCVPEGKSADAVNESLSNSHARWVVIQPPGASFEPNYLLVLADYINVRPTWRLIYTDDDLIDDAGKRRDPRFKPDFNLDLLRSSDYLGGFAVERQALLSVGGIPDLSESAPYDIALRVLDTFGADAIGHVDDVLVHYPRLPILDDVASAEALRAHLARNGIAADVAPGYQSGMLRVVYRHDQQPRVSIIIPSKDRFELIDPCLASLFEKTNYPDFEVLVVDNGSSDPDVLALYSSMAASHGARFRVVPFPHPFNFSAMCNLGVAEASGQYILLLNNDTQIIQADWLGRLMEHGQRPEVGIVGARLVFPESSLLQHAGVVLGMNGYANHPFIGQVDITQPGYMGRAQVDQNYSAVTAACMLVRKTVWQEVSGMDEKQFAVLFNDVDFCLRVREKGFNIVWTPYSTVIHLANMSIKGEQRDSVKQAESLRRAESECDALLRNWLPVMARDPAYNRHLSLDRVDWSVDGTVVIDWDPNFHDRSRVLGVPLSGGSGQYRVVAPLNALGSSALAQCCIVEPPKYFQSRILLPVELARAAPDTLVVQAAINDGDLSALQQYAKYLPDMMRVFSLDDLITQPPPKSPFYQQHYRDGRARLRRGLSYCDRAVVSTEPLLDLCRDMIGDVRLIPNRLQRSKWGNVASRRRMGHRPRVGWAGAQQHMGDLELIFDVVRELSQEVDWVFMGMCPDPLKPYIAEFVPFEIGYDDYVRRLASLNLDLAVAPLEVHAFNEAKSNLRLLEYGYLGWPVVCTDILPYQGAPVTRVSNTKEEWMAAIRERIHDLDAAEREGDVLRQWVLDNYMLEDHLDDWLSAFTR